MTDFEHLSRLVTVQDAARPILCEFDADCSGENAWEVWCGMCMDRDTDPMEELALVTTDGVVSGWVAFDSLENGKTLGEVADPVLSTQLVSRDTPLEDMAEAFADCDPHFYLVLTGKRITHVLWYDSLYCLPFRVSLFVLLLEVERVVAAALSREPRFSLSLLPEARQEKARVVYIKRGLRHAKEDGEASALLECTTYIDKWKMLKKHELMFRLLPFASSTEGESYFSLAQAVRDATAHGRSLTDVVKSRNDLHHLIERSKEIIGALANRPSGDRDDLNLGRRSEGGRPLDG